MRSELAALLLLTLLGCRATEPHEVLQPAWPLVYASDFERADELNGLALSDPQAWRWSEQGGRTALELVGESDYAPPHRSPHSLALLPRLEVADFDLEVELLQTGRDYGHRDMCLFFGFQEPSRYYYVHLASAPDANAHNVFLVDGAPRRNLAEVAPAGIDWGRDTWHHVRIERRVEAGTIAVYWDGGAQPILRASDDTLGWGRIGFGSFDDSGRVTGVRVWAPESRPLSSAAQPFE